ncbi:hypothetical protein CRM22_003017 [Opisthorchis felineus]|uniref:Uncharacterized protein n=1 Tax=Opisthorchis felineus TaxID=147828 RepID=A0A4S2M392_OPIFE|nr:hypothetical protein CRM22_003017 [Opisthorchis felineus]TGZ70761.1 hypothetical protein CRM22_003017 [Opisthorchis felineus]
MEALLQKLENYMKSGSRHLQYPWTVSSKIRQFPYVYYYKNNIVVKNYFYSLILTTPVTLYIFLKIRKAKKASQHHIDYFDPNQIPAKKLLSHHH